MEAKKINTIVITVLAILVVVVLVLAAVRFIGGSTYVRIVDTSAERSLEGTAPGADIDAIAIEQWEGEERTKAWFAETIVKDPYADSDENGVAEAYADPQSALGNPEDDEKTTFVALNGGELIVKVPKRLRKGLTLSVYEVGAVNAVKADAYEVYTSSKQDGPWELLGDGSGPFSKEIE